VEKGYYSGMFLFDSSQFIEEVKNAEVHNAFKAESIEEA